MYVYAYKKHLFQHSDYNILPVCVYIHVHVHVLSVL